MRLRQYPNTLARLLDKIRYLHPEKVIIRLQVARMTVTQNQKITDHVAMPARKFLIVD